MFHAVRCITANKCALILIKCNGRITMKCMPQVGQVGLNSEVCSRTVGPATLNLLTYTYDVSNCEHFLLMMFLCLVEVIVYSSFLPRHLIIGNKFEFLCLCLDVRKHSACNPALLIPSPQSKSSSFIPRYRRFSP